MTVEIMVGLPHLNPGPILQRAIDMHVPALISANALSRWSRSKGWPDWRGWNLAALDHARELASLSLDSAGFVAMARYGGYPWRTTDYLVLAASYPFRWFASMDYCVEPEIARDREEVLDRISRTIRANFDCRSGARDLGIEHRLMPVIQGRRPEDYERCLDGLLLDYSRTPLIGVGSLCRREVSGPEGLIAVLDHLDRILPRDVRLHGFGVKGTALSHLKGLEYRLASTDSQAYGQTARHDALVRGVPKTDRLVAQHMQAWTCRQFARLGSPRQVRQPELPLARADPHPTDPWERAIAQARAEIRVLVEDGDIGHEDVTALWVEQWAADIYRDGRAA
ncbi:MULTISPECIES: DUF7221 family queuine tRNA-ribosyltransferase-like protein [Sphingobium]|jgi:hypothetical protein|uniref:DeoxyPurine in DNA protein A domain-containing protein n=3 Tax=Sphingobium TaxID=165695 RepID=A0A6P1GED8_SPHYA|nr:MULTISPECIES: hypothetical protein [Sphingobium]EQB16816.1 hypothetical protein RLDS_06775 [Sphingobium lactosutens DS20]QDC36654.1 hypothetical protein FIL70_04755 [Sphingobium fuliginis ATCC 27551]QHD66750.1 hypothetical protein GS397_06575 [Sphingobium yanoikuyae]QNG43861.1 hypothetical protein H3V42_18270 [Sphingobium yanoikuyae]